jgi:hypothetical protein
MLRAALAFGVIAAIAATPVAHACDATESPEAMAAAFEEPQGKPSEPPDAVEAPAPEAPRARRAPRVWSITPPVAPVPAAPVAPRQMAPSRVLPRGWFGFAMQCDECSAIMQPSDSVAVWVFETRPRIYSVEPGSPAAKAGLLRGDEITHIDGVSILTEEGGRRFSMTRPGQRVRWTVLREGAPRQALALAQVRPERRPEQVAAEERAKKMAELRLESRRLGQIQDLDRLRAEIERLNERIADLQLDTPRPSLLRRAPAAPRPLRYAGVIGATEVEVRGPSSVVVSAGEDQDELVINIGESVIVIRKSAKK